MKNINILDSNLINKIAAGEVVERPSGVCKELIENSIDASATMITVEIKDGGISYIRVTDNGEGIERSQVKNAFLRHATSKIKTIEDLVCISSLGFRGEALSSICAVSKTELLTKVKDDFIGVRYVIDGGRECVFEDAGVPDGTTVIVKDLFSNVPARRKFLKTAATEGNYITELMEHMILANPDISFKYIANGKVKLQSFGDGNIKSCIYTVYGRDVCENLIEVKSKAGDINIYGYIGKPEISRSTRSFQIYFVNNRMIKSTLIDKALDEAYKSYLMLHKYPTVFLYMEIPGELIDVNVHPTKKEIRFLDGLSLKTQIVNTIEEALSKKELIPEIKEKEENKPEKTPVIISPEPFENSLKQTVKEEAIAEQVTEAPAKITKEVLKQSEANEQAYTKDMYEPNRSVNLPTGSKNKQLSLFEDNFISEEASKKHRIIGQLFDTYWLVEYDNKMFIIDQHAAHEKVNYERMIKRLKANENLSQNIYPPLVLTLSNSEADYVKKYIDYFTSVGFTIEHFGGMEYTISTVPVELLSVAPSLYFHEMLDELIEGKTDSQTDIINQKIAKMACKSSVKGNTKLSFNEADALIGELLSLDNPYNCPHGRPTIISYSKYEIEKLFKRII